MSTDKYVPSDEDVRESYVTGQIRDGYGVDWDDLEPGAVLDFDAWLAAHDARVRRDAAREALDRLAAESNNAHNSPLAPPAPRSWGETAGVAEWYRDTHYPEVTP